MRYTLRLLTLQQFQRASSLICACEMIRRGDSSAWGQTPFRLGLGVGQRSTPNTTQESAEAITQQHGIHNLMFGGGSGSPHQLTNCPWCGATIDGGTNISVNRVHPSCNNHARKASKPAVSLRNVRSSLQHPWGACSFSVSSSCSHSRLERVGQQGVVRPST